MPLVSSLVAKLETPKIGTAYPIAKGYIITAYHVFPELENEKCIDFSKAKVIWQRNDEIKEGKEVPAGKEITGILYQSKKYDVVIAACETPAETTSVVWASSDVRKRWESIGFAKSGKDQNLKQRLKDPAKGGFYTSQDDDWIQQLESKGNASDVELWRGMSGAPVFIENTSYLAAVIIETPRKDKEGKPVHEDRLYSVSILYLLKNCESFNKAIQKIQLENKSSFFLKKTALHIEENSLMPLFKNQSLDMATNEELAHSLSLMSIKDFLRLIEKLQNTFDKPVELGQLVCTLLPHIFDEGKANEIRASVGQQCSCIAIPYASDVAVEMLMAKADSRPTNWVLTSINKLQARFKLPLLPEDAGEKELLKQAALDDAYQSYGGDTQRLVASHITHHLYQEEIGKKGNILEPEDEQEKKDFISDILEDRSEEDRESYYFILDLKSLGSQSEIHTFETALKQAYPHCVIVQCSTDREIRREENRSFNKLSQVLSPHLQNREPSHD